MFDIAIKPTPRTSTCVEAITVNPVAGTAKVRFASNGYEYKYSNVSRAKIVNLLMQDNISLGFWSQELSKNAVRALSYLRGNTVATGKLCYELTGCTNDATAPLPF